MRQEPSLQNYQPIQSDIEQKLRQPSGQQQSFQQQPQQNFQQQQQEQCFQQPPDQKFTKEQSENEKARLEKLSQQGAERPLDNLKISNVVDDKNAQPTEIKGIYKIGPVTYMIKKGFVPNMRVDGLFFVDEELKKIAFDELREHTQFLPALKQVANVACLPGIVGYSMGMPDIHSGYGFAIGNVAAFDMDDPEAVVSPGGVGFDINCGVRLIRTNLTEEEVSKRKEELCQRLFDVVPVGVGSTGDIRAKEFDEVLDQGIDWAIRENFAWPEDKLHCEEQGRMQGADHTTVSTKAKQRGRPQLGTLGAGNHYCEVQVVDEIFDQAAADKLQLKLGQVVIFIHTGSRGLGHQVASDSLREMEKAMRRDNIVLNDRQLACARIKSPEGQRYLKAMQCAANFAWVNRQAITHLVRGVFETIFGKTAREMDMHLIYDVCHNVAKIEKHNLNGVEKTLLVHRKGATRAFAPHHPMIPADYQEIGQPALIGGSMGTLSYLVLGTEQGMKVTFGSTCHGAGRKSSRTQAIRNISSEETLNNLKAKGIAIRVASPSLVMEEAPESYKDVTHVVDTCEAAGISKKCVKLRPICCIKG